MSAVLAVRSSPADQPRQYLAGGIKAAVRIVQEKGLATNRVAQTLPEIMDLRRANLK